MITVSVCMIVKNEEHVLEKSLTCAKQIADEIIVVDTGSSDKTKEIAQRFTKYVYDFEWCDDFSKARNFAFSKATQDYCMWLDADDVILQEDIEGIKALKQRLDLAISIVMMKYNTAFDEQGKPTFSYYRERLIQRKANLKWEGVIHEVIPLKANIVYEDIAITHNKVKVADPNRNIRIFESLIKKGEKLSPREQFYYARELYYHSRYEDAITMFQQFLDEKCGWIENNIDACELMGNCYDMLHKEEEALYSFFKSFVYDVPRAELCCAIGKHFFDRLSYDKAMYWYQQALNIPRNDSSGAFVRGDCYGYIPSLQLSVCYYYRGDLKKAIAYNEKAGEYKEESREVQQNRLFYEGL